MAKRTYAEKEAAVAEWYDTIMTYWKKYDGVMHGKADYWDDCFHNKTFQDWEDLFEVSQVLRIKHPDEWGRQKHITGDFDEINKRTMFRKEVIKQWQQEYNYQIFRAVMAFKDFLTDVLSDDIAVSNPKPAKILPPEKAKAEHKIQKKVDHFNSLFEINITITAK